MKVKTLLKELYAACISHNTELEKKLWLKAIKKSLKHKKTQAIK
jgi:hypothetical protein